MRPPQVSPDLHDYSAFGLRIRSMIELPEFNRTTRHLNPDVRIERGRVAEPAVFAAGMTLVDGALVLLIPEVGRYRIADGSLITIDAVPGVPPRNVRVYLLGSAFGALLHQRGLLPLHANAIEIEGRAVAFMGASGEGKSTLAAWFHDQGHRVLADDVSVVKRSDKGRWCVAPGTQRLRLWMEALEVSGRDTAKYRRSFEGLADAEKFDVPIDNEGGGMGELELAAIYLLESGGDFSIDRIIGVEAVDAVFSHTYRGAFVNMAGTQQSHWEASVELIKQVPIFRFSRPRNLRLLREVGVLVHEHLSGSRA